MAFVSLDAARTGVMGTNATWYASSGNGYMESGATALTLTSDLHIYVYSNTGSWTLPIVSSTELVSIPKVYLLEETDGDNIIQEDDSNILLEQALQ